MAKFITIQYKSFNPKYKRFQYYLKEVTEAVYHYKYLPLQKSGIIEGLEILPSL